MPNYTIKLNDVGSTEFSPHLLLHKDTKYEIGLIHGLIPYSWKNISASKGNNTFTFGGVPKVIEDGTYDLDSLLEIVQELTGSAAIDFIPRRHTGFVKVANGSASDLVLQSIAPVLGFPNPTTILAGANATSPNRADFSGGIKEIELHCNLVDRRYTRHQGRTSDILKSIIVESEPLGHIEVARDIHYVPMTHLETLNIITVEIKDQIGNVVDLNGGSAEFIINIRPA